VPDRLGPGVGQAHPIEELVGPAAGGGLAQPVEPAEQDEVLAAAENLVDGRLLAAEADPPPDLVGGASHVGAGHHRPAAVGSQEGGEHPDRGRLAGAVRAEQAADGAGGDRQVEPVERPGVAEALVEALGLDRQQLVSHRHPRATQYGVQSIEYGVRSVHDRVRVPWRPPGIDGPAVGRSPDL
jgi:hypothetical protein